MPIPNYKLIIFDLDGTLTPSKSPLEPVMADLLVRLIKKVRVAVISGCGYPQFVTQFLSKFPHYTEGLSNLILLPTSGTRMYLWRGTWSIQYAEDLTQPEKDKILTAINESLKAIRFIMPEKTYGQLIEDRGSQITFSALGQLTPIAIKSTWDPDHRKRLQLIEILSRKIPRFDIRVGGMTSVDITRRGVNKAYGIRKLEEHFKLVPEDILFVGDSLFRDGNDFPAKATGVDCLPVKDPEETRTIIEGWLE